MDSDTEHDSSRNDTEADRRSDHMVIGAFVQASMTKTSMGGWLLPSTELGWLTPEYYTQLAITLERSGFDLMFFDDRLAVPARYRGTAAGAIERGARAVKLDLLPILGLLCGATHRIGLGATYSTTYSNPFHVSRSFATLDHLSRGRAVWNIVTSLNQDEAENFGVDHTVPGDRYDLADEFLEVTTRLWESWGRHALKLDRESGVFADPSAVRAIDYKGNRYASKGPLTVPRPPQGWPLLLQAGQSPRGRAFGARWADMIFMSVSDKQSAREQYADLQQRMESCGRQSTSAKLLPSVAIIVAETTELAAAKAAHFDSFVDVEEELIYCSEVANFDLGSIPLETELGSGLLQEVTGSSGLLEKWFRQTREMFGVGATIRDLAIMRSQQFNLRFVGSPADVADQMEAWFEHRACDGFLIQPTNVPGSYEDVARLVMPELRRRGLVAGEGLDGTLRERLGLARRDAEDRY